MIFPVTGIIFAFGTFVYFFLSRRFWQYYKLEGNYIAKIFSFSFFLIGLNYLFKIVPCLLLTENQTVWRIISPLGILFISAGYGLIIYIAAWMRLRKYLRFIVGLLLIVLPFLVISFVINPPHNFFIDGILTWELNQLSGLIASEFLSALIFLPIAIMFFQESKKTADKRAKIRAFGLGLAMIFFILVGMIDVTLLNVFKVHPIYSDLNYFIMFSILAVTLIWTWGAPKTKIGQKIE